MNDNVSHTGIVVDPFVFFAPFAGADIKKADVLHTSDLVFHVLRVYFGGDILVNNLCNFYNG